MRWMVLLLCSGQLRAPRNAAATRFKISPTSKTPTSEANPTPALRLTIAVPARLQRAALAGGRRREMTL